MSHENWINSIPVLVDLDAAPATKRPCDCGADHYKPRRRPHDPHCGTVTYVSHPTDEGSKP